MVTCEIVRQYNWIGFHPLYAANNQGQLVTTDVSQRKNGSINIIVSLTSSRQKPHLGSVYSDVFFSGEGFMKAQVVLLIIPHPKKNILLTWQFCWWPFWDGKKRDPKSRANRDLQRSGIKKVTNWITWHRCVHRQGVSSCSPPHF